MKIKRLALLSIATLGGVTLLSCSGNTNPTTTSNVPTPSTSTPTPSSSTTPEKSYSEDTKFLIKYLEDGTRASKSTDKVAFDVDLDLNLTFNIAANTFDYNFNSDNDLYIDLSNITTGEKVLDKGVALLESKNKIKNNKDNSIPFSADFDMHYVDNALYFDTSLSDNGYALGIKELVDQSTNTTASMVARALTFVYSLNIYKSTPELSVALIESLKDQIAPTIDSLGIKKKDTDTEYVYTLDLSSALSNEEETKGVITLHLAKEGYKINSLNVDVENFDISTLLSLYAGTIDFSSFDLKAKKLSLVITPKEYKEFSVPTQEELNNYKKLELAKLDELKESFGKVKELFSFLSEDYYPEVNFALDLGYVLASEAEEKPENNIKVLFKSAVIEAENENENNVVVADVDLLIKGPATLLGSLNKAGDGATIDGKVSIKLQIDGPKVAVKISTTNLDEVLNDQALAKLNTLIVFDLSDEDGQIKNALLSLLGLILPKNNDTEEEPVLEPTTSLLSEKNPNTIYVADIVKALVDILTFTKTTNEGNDVYTFDLTTAKLQALLDSLHINFELPEGINSNITLTSGENHHEVNADLKNIVNELAKKFTKNVDSITKFDVSVGFNKNVSIEKLTYADTDVKVLFSLTDVFNKVKDIISKVVMKVLTNEDLATTLQNLITNKKGNYDLEFVFSQTKNNVLNEYNANINIAFDFNTDKLAKISGTVVNKKGEEEKTYNVLFQLQNNTLYGKIYNPNVGSEEEKFILKPGKLVLNQEDLTKLAKDVVAKVVKTIIAKKSTDTEEDKKIEVKSLDKMFNYDLYVKAYNMLFCLDNALEEVSNNLIKVTKTATGEGEEATTNYKLDISLQTVMALFSYVQGGDISGDKPEDYDPFTMILASLNVNFKNKQFTDCSFTIDESIKSLLSFIGINDIKLSVKAKDIVEITPLTAEEIATYTNFLFEDLLK